MRVLKFGAVWCNGCIVMKPRWQKLEKKYEWLKTEYFEFDDHPELAEKYGIVDERLPVFVFLSESGEELERLSGEIEETVLEEKIVEHKDK